MTDTPNAPKIVASLLEVKRDLGAIAKQNVDAGPGGRFKAFAVDDIYSHLGPLFAKHGVVVLPRFVEQELGETERGRRTSRVTIDYDFIAEDGSTLTMTFGAEGHDGQDKATNKAAQQALKYGLIQMFQISTGEVDPDAAVVVDPPSTKTPAERRMNAVKSAAWDLVYRDGVDQDVLVAEATKLVGQVLDLHGSEPKNKDEIEILVGLMEDLVAPFEPPNR